MTVKVEHFSWCKTDKNDKVWGIVRIEDNIYTFWGARTGVIRFKIFSNRGYSWGVHRELDNLIASKEKKGYEEYCDPNQVIPDFESHLKKCLFNAKMLDKVI
jgi:predicted DNA-binding WGR domain protein